MSESKIYGYCRISTPAQSIDRQIRNIKKDYSSALIITETYTGTTQDRPEWIKLLSHVQSGDTIVFDSVSRMSRNAEEGISDYFALIDKGIVLKFLKEPYIDSDVYLESKADKIALNGSDEDEIFKGLNNYFRRLAAKQIRLAFEQSEKEVSDLRQRTREGIETARRNGKQIGQVSGTHLHVKKKAPVKELIRKYSKDFNGTLSDSECIAILKEKKVGVCRNTYYRYKKELKKEFL